jgi:hypothetical protein
MNKNEVLESEVSKYFVEDGILNIVFKDGVTVELSHVKTNFELRKKMQQGTKMLTLVDVRGVWGFMSAAREFAAKKSVSDLSIAYAILTGKSTPVRLVANFFIKFNKPAIPTKLFKSKKKAIGWLNNLS